VRVEIEVLLQSTRNMCKDCQLNEQLQSVEWLQYVHEGIKRDKGSERCKRGPHSKPRSGEEPGNDIGAGFVDTVVDRLDILLADISNISHEVCDVSF